VSERRLAMSDAEWDDADPTAEMARLRSQIAALEQLLEVYEQTSLQQAERLEQAVATVDNALAEAQLERQRLYDVFMQAPAAIAVLEGPAHVFTVANPRYRELVGGRPVLGKPVRDALPEVAGQGILDLLDRVYESGEPYAASEMGLQLDRDGDGVAETIYVDFVYQPLHSADGRAFGIMAHAVDVTTQVEARQDAERRADELARLGAELARSNQDLDQFAYVASHDLKAPLRGIANLTAWIEEDLGDQLSPESREHMQLLKGRVHRMEALIDGILTYSRAGRVHEEPVAVDVGALVAECVELLAPPPETEVVIRPGMPTLVTERVPLQQVFMNLISNAIKYNQRVGARVEVAAEPEGNGYRFAVSDNGPGIEARYRERIWQIFQTLAARDKVEGTGIGLSVVRKIIETRGGATWLESDVGKGTTFYFTWPSQPERHS
jgi:signal transduction histidine kinase